MSHFVCRAMQWQDLAAVIRIQAEAYVDEILETDEVIQARFAQTPDSSWVVEREGEVYGYLVGYHSALGDVTPWGFEFTHKPQANTLYLHDLAISQSAKGFGLGPLVVNHALAEARQRQLEHAAAHHAQHGRQQIQQGQLQSAHAPMVTSACDPCGLAADVFSPGRGLEHAHGGACHAAR